MPIAPPDEENDDQDPAEQGKWGERDMPPDADPRDYLSDWGDEDDEPSAARQSQR